MKICTFHVNDVVQPARTPVRSSGGAHGREVSIICGSIPLQITNVDNGDLRFAGQLGHFDAKDFVLSSRQK